MAKAPTGIDLARKLCEAHPTATSKSLGRRLYRENVERFPNEEAAYCCIRRARGNAGEQNRKACNATPERRPNGRAGWVAECPPSHAEPWVPFDLGGGIKVLSLSDIHVPYHEPKAVEAAVKFGRKWKPDVLLLLGDISDFYSISRWDRDPKKRDLVGECEQVYDMLAWFRKAFPKARIVYKLGNHEERWDHYIWNKCAELWGLDALRLESVLKLDELGIEMVGDKRPVMIGPHLVGLHGHELVRGLTSPVNQARGLFMRTLHSALAGHGHTTSTHVQGNMLGKEIACWSQGCLCNLHPLYMPINTHNHGFAAVDVDSNGEFNLMNYRISSDWKVRTA